MQTLAQLIAVPTLDEARQTMITIMQSVGFSNAGSWQPGSLARACGIEVPAALLVQMKQLVSVYALGGYNDTATGDWLTLYSLSAYDNFRKGALRARGYVLLAAVPTAPNHQIDEGYLVVADSARGVTFRNVAAATIVPGSVISVLVEAEIAGTDGNANAGDIDTMRTPLAGVTVSNAADWLTVRGTDVEAETALRVRNRSKWATRAVSATRDAYIYWALESSPQIARAEVDDNNPDGPGTLTVYIAAQDGPLASTYCDTVLQYVNGQVDGVMRRGIGALVSCESAQEVTVPVAGTIWIAASYKDSAPLAVQAALTQFERELPIGGTRIDNGPGAVRFAALYGAIMRVPGVVNAALSTPLADVSLARNQIAKLALALTYPVVA